MDLPPPPSGQFLLEITYAINRCTGWQDEAVDRSCVSFGHSSRSCSIQVSSDVKWVGTGDISSKIIIHPNIRGSRPCLTSEFRKIETHEVNASARSGTKHVGLSCALKQGLFNLRAYTRTSVQCLDVDLRSFFCHVKASIDRPHECSLLYRWH